MTTRTVYISVGNTDHGLSQPDWSEYTDEIVEAVQEHAELVLGEYYSPPNFPYQNACVAAKITDKQADELRPRLAGIREKYGKACVYWAAVDRTERV